MSTRTQHINRFAGAGLFIASVALFGGCGGGGGGGSASTNAGSPPMVSMAGTAATGKALANAMIAIDCVQGSMTVAADANGNYNATFAATMPCTITATSGGTTLHSLAFAGGTFNVTPETDLLLSFIAAQLGTNESALIAGFATNAQFQQTLQNQSGVLSAQSAVVQNLEQKYAFALSTPGFLTTAFAVGQPGEDGDLDALSARGAIDTNGEPDATAVALIVAMGAANPVTTSTGTGSSGSGGAGTGGAGSTGGMM